jgi:cobalt transporter subunit CbtA
MLHRVLGLALLAGFAAAFAASILQFSWSVPLILDAEVYEHFGGELPPGGFALAKGQMELDAALAGESIWWRHGLTIVSNLLFATGAAFVLAGLFTLFGLGGLKRGLAWGAGGFLAIAAAPALGLPPELPGTIAAELSARQGWWLATAGATAAGLAMLAFSGSWFAKLAGVVLMVLPHAVGAPQPEVHESVVPAALAQEFIAASLASSAAFWLTLGAAVGMLMRKFGLDAHAAGEQPQAT